MKTAKILFPIIPVLLLAACSNPADDVPEAKVSSATTTPDGAATAEGRVYAMTPDNSTIAFVGSKVTGKHDGGFRRFAGELRVVDGKVADTGNKVVIATGSIWSDTERLTGHLKSPDFFDAGKYPTSTFETISVTANQTNSTVTGNLTLHGVTRQISFPATIKVSDDTVEVAAEFFINRFDFEMKYPGKADDLIRKEVVLKLNVKATPGQADFNSVTTPADAAQAPAQQSASLN